MPSLSQDRTPEGADSPAGLGWGRPGLGSPVPSAAAAALLRRGSAFAAAAAAAVRGGGRHVTAEHSLPAPLPRHCGAQTAGAEAAEAPTLPLAAPHNRSRGRPFCAPVLQVGKQSQRGQGLAQGYTARLWQGPGENPAIQPMLQGDRDKFWSKWGTRPRPPWAPRACGWGESERSAGLAGHGGRAPAARPPHRGAGCASCRGPAAVTLPSGLAAVAQPSQTEQLAPHFRPDRGKGGWGEASLQPWSKEVEGRQKLAQDKC